MLETPAASRGFHLRKDRKLDFNVYDQVVVYSYLSNKDVFKGVVLTVPTKDRILYSVVVVTPLNDNYQVGQTVACSADAMKNTEETKDDTISDLRQQVKTANYRYGKASDTIGRQRAELALLREKLKKYEVPTQTTMAVDTLTYYPIPSAW